jgi:predicted O-methyltransferase YrrM
MDIKSRALFGHLAQLFYQTGIGAEIGVERGNFSRLILSQWSGKLMSIDMWVHEEIYKEACKNLLSEERCIMIKESSVSAAEQTLDESLDFVYIDADHSYAACREDIEAWLPKVRHGGLVAGHDYLNWTIDQGAGCDFGVKAAVDEYCSKHGYKLHVTTEDFWHGNPYQTWWFVKEIPRIIYYTWVSPDPLPDKFQKYIDGWRVLMPDYQIVQISLDNIVKTPFVMDAIKRGLYAVAGHYGRCERLLATGGIYFDIDIEAVKRFDDLLGEKMFVATEVPHRVNNAVIGAAPNHPFMKDALNYLDNIVFHDPGPLGIEIETGPEMFTKLAKAYGWKEKDETQRLSWLTVFNSKLFYPYYFDQVYHPGCATEETYAIHHWAKTWIPK